MQSQQLFPQANLHTCLIVRIAPRFIVMWRAAFIRRIGRRRWTYRILRLVNKGLLLGLHPSLRCWAGFVVGVILLFAWLIYKYFQKKNLYGAI
jgi:hypothetical protein